MEVREERRAMVKRNEDGKFDRGVLFVRIEEREGHDTANGERSSSDGISVRVRSRCVRLGNRRRG